MYRLYEARIEVACDRCAARKAFTGPSVVFVKQQARDMGWLLAVLQPGQRDGATRCPDCAAKLKRRIRRG